MESTYTVYVHTTPSGKKYIGITSRVAAQRWGSGGRGYIRCSYFWNAICKHGWDNITHEVLFTGLTEAEAKQREKDLIIACKTKDPEFGYNLTDGGDGSCGCIPSVATRAKHSAAGMGRVVSAETRAAISAGNMGRCLGRKATDSTRAKMSAWQMGHQRNLGRKHTDEARENMSAAQTGRTQSEETKQKLRAAHTGKTLTAEHRAAIGDGLMGKIHSDETKQRMRAAWVRRRERQT